MPLSRRAASKRLPSGACERPYRSAAPGAGLKHGYLRAADERATFLEQATIVAEKMIPGVRVIPFGHMGDGNIHFNLSRPEGDDGANMMSMAHDLEVAVHDLAVELDGSFSAEHGIGKLKRDELARYKSDVELDLMQRLKFALDPNGIMNPGKIL